MNTLELPAPAKLNLFLHITGRRADGYHDLQTVFQILDRCDTLEFSRLEYTGIRFTCSDPALQADDNLVLRAARLLEEELRPKRGALIHLEKILPMGGGVGGGSSDAATTLVGLNSLWNGDLTIEELARLGLALGADVPVFIKGFSAWAEGVGENLQVIDLPERWYLVLTPDCHVSTGEVFSHPELTRNTLPIKIAAFPFSGSKNDCEMLVSSLYLPVRRALNWLSGFGEARMTGTGASVFAAFETEAEAQQVLAQAELLNEADTGPGNVSAFVAKGVNESPLHPALRKVCQNLV